MVRKLKVGLIGCGVYAADVHLPAIRQMREHVQLVWVADVNAAATQEWLSRADFGNLTEPPVFHLFPPNQHPFQQLPAPQVPVINLLAAPGLPPGITVFPRPPEAMLAYLQPWLAQAEAVIVSTYGMSHYDYCRAALDAGRHTFVQKPLTVREFCSTDPGQADLIYQDYQDLLHRAESRLLFMIDAQRRYQPAYREIAQLLVDGERKTDEQHGVTFVQCMTSDGWWLTDQEILSHRGYDPLQSGGGKLVHTGYHLLDIVTWLLRHTCMAISSADVCVSLQRPADLRPVPPTVFQSCVANLAVPPGLVLPAGCITGPAGTSIPFRYLPEANITLHITLYDKEGRTRCLIQMGMLHEGLSLRGCQGAKSRRTKQEIMHLYQGPVGMITLRRIAKLTGVPDHSLGGDGHYELLAAKNSEVLGGGLSLVQYPTHYDEQATGPTLDFLRKAHRVVCCGEALNDPPVTSPVSDHGIGIQLLAAAYRSAATAFALNAPPMLAPEHVVFGPWVAPPN